MFPSPGSETSKKAPNSLATSAATLLVVVTGSMVGILGALFEETLQFSLLLPFVAAPIIEEALKPCGIYLLQVKWPHMLRSRLHTAALSALSGLCFAIVENILYLWVYVPDHTATFVVYRFTVPVLVHSVSSFIWGFGVNSRLIASIRGDVPLLSGSRRFFVAAIVLHSAYNITATALGLTILKDTFQTFKN